MNELEFKTFKAISKPGKKIPGINDEELIFLLVYYLFAIVSMIIFLGMIPNIFGIQLNQKFVNTFMSVFFVLLPVISFIIIKTSSFGKQEGYVFQKTYLWFQSSLPNEIDLRDSSMREEVKKWNKRRLGFIYNKDTYLKSSNEELRKYNILWDEQEEKRRIEKFTEKNFEMFENYLKNKKNKEYFFKNKFKEEFNEEINTNFWYSFYKKI